MRHVLAATVGTMLLTLAACGDQPNQVVEPAIPAGEELDTELDLEFSRRSEPGSVVRWNRKSFVLFRTTTPTVDFGRANAYLGLAQYRAVGDARCHRNRQPRVAIAGAAAAASAVILKQFYPAAAADIDAELEAQRAELANKPRWQEAFAEGEAVGRAVGERVLAQAATDNLGLTPLPTQPVGPGYWVSSGAPTVRALYGVRPFFLRHGDEINAPRPPAFGSAKFNRALAEIRTLSDGRTPEQVALSQKWVPFSAPLFSEKAADLVEKHRLGDAAAARIFAYANTAAFDAIIGCFHTKFVYWFIRPTQADPLITTAVGLPNHPSYPSAHSCQSGAWEGTLAHFFPSERRSIHAMAMEASESRIVGGLHYRFDGDAGLELGRKAATLALRRGLR